MLLSRKMVITVAKLKNDLVVALEDMKNDPTMQENVELMHTIRMAEILIVHLDKIEKTDDEKKNEIIKVFQSSYYGSATK